MQIQNFFQDLEMTKFIFNTFPDFPDLSRKPGFLTLSPIGLHQRALNVCIHKRQNVLAPYDPCLTQHASHLVSLALGLGQLDDGVGDGGAGGRHLLHHQQPGAVDSQHVARRRRALTARCGDTQLRFVN